MNYLAIDYGTKRIGLAITVMDIISPIDGIPNDKSIFDNLNKIISSYKIDKIFVGMCEGDFAIKTKKFVTELRSMVKLPVETIEESVSTIEANKLFSDNKKKKKKYKKSIDSIAAAIILRRATNF